jgi:hypothetical protein
MANQHWRSRLVTALRRQGLPRAYVDRLVEELSDHTTDLFLEDQSMDAQQEVEARLGSPEQLAAVAKAEFQKRTFAGRHPAVTFLAGPIIAVTGTFAASIMLLFAVTWLIDLATGGSLTANDEANLPPSTFETGLMQFFNGVVRFAPFALSAWFFARLGRRSGRAVWSIIACGIVAVIAILFWSVMTQRPGDKGMWMMGIGWRGWKIGIDQILQAAVPLAFGVWALRQFRMSRCAGDSPSPAAS